ncbi:MAG: rhomboid family intramembrane serine protease [Pseudomonadota bacterium]
MFLIVPLGKKGSTGIPIFTLFICVACVIVHVFANNNADQLALAFYPDQLDPLKMFTSVFTHTDLWHLLGNLFFFYCFARTIETRISTSGYLLAFLVFVLVTNLAYAAVTKEAIPTVGLSGIVWGYMGMFLFRYPKDDIDCFVWWLWIVRTIEIPAFLFILAFLAFDVAAYRNADSGAVNHVVHFSGFIAGALYKLAFWNVFSDEPPAPKRRPVYGTRRARWN